MAALRVVLGIFEAGFFPGSVYLLRYVIHIVFLLVLIRIVLGMCDTKFKRDIQYST
jgi:hypothetical protein